eukprot:NODE_312_length_2258_cov_12.464011_g244_i0.p1 GENE.NODE_312_length_2258_cov_12.464011_g244_i0~~NODE_312_length_2258_cov_12.464011_g244_i0.p1  ORF type:complete len:254 (+),score=39.23 NODE_312_length_2258_cov_12.464011_g244_i0:878-1639(+)
MSSTMASTLPLSVSIGRAQRAELHRVFWALGIQEKGLADLILHAAGLKEADLWKEPWVDHVCLLAYKLHDDALLRVGRSPAIARDPYGHGDARSDLSGYLNGRELYIDYTLPIAAEFLAHPAFPAVLWPYEEGFSFRPPREALIDNGKKRDRWYIWSLRGQTLSQDCDAALICWSRSFHPVRWLNRMKVSEPTEKGGPAIDPGFLRALVADVCEKCFSSVSKKRKVSEVTDQEEEEEDDQDEEEDDQDEEEDD